MYEYKLGKHFLISCMTSVCMTILWNNPRLPIQIYVHVYLPKSVVCVCVWMFKMFVSVCLMDAIISQRRRWWRRRQQRKRKSFAKNIVQIWIKFAFVTNFYEFYFYACRRCERDHREGRYNDFLFTNSTSSSFR